MSDQLWQATDDDGERSTWAMLAKSLRCLECRRALLVSAEPWRVYLTEDTPPLAVPYCPACARREFG
jgi:hypothetical protein